MRILTPIIGSLFSSITCPVIRLPPCCAKTEIVPPKRAVHNMSSTVRWRRFKMLLFIINVLLIIDLLLYLLLDQVLDRV